LPSREQITLGQAHHARSFQLIKQVDKMIQ